MDDFWLAVETLWHAMRADTWDFVDGKSVRPGGSLRTDSLPSPPCFQLQMDDEHLVNSSFDFQVRLLSKVVPSDTSTVGATAIGELLKKQGLASEAQDPAYQHLVNMPDMSTQGRGKQWDTTSLPLYICKEDSSFMRDYCSGEDGHHLPDLIAEIKSCPHPRARLTCWSHVKFLSTELDWPSDEIPQYCAVGEVMLTFPAHSEVQVDVEEPFHTLCISTPYSTSYERLHLPEMP